MRRAILSFVLLTGCATTHDAARPDPVPPAETPEEAGAPLADPHHIADPSPALTAAPSPPPTPRSKEKRSSGTIKRADLLAVLDAAPGRFLQNVDIEPRFAGGRFHGWKLASFFPGDARFATVDLQAGDVVVSINGQPIEKPDQVMQLWQSLRVDHALVVLLERDGVPRQLRYDIAD